MFVSRNPKFPVFDPSGFPLHLAVRKDGMLDIGCLEGLFSDGRPFYARLWSENGSSCLSLFCSAEGLSCAEKSRRSDNPLAEIKAPGANGSANSGFHSASSPSVASPAAAE